MAYDEHLAARVRDLLADAPQLSEKAMFGGLGFMVAGNLALAASRHGGLMVRSDPERSEQLLTTTSARRMEMKGRAMANWLYVDEDELATPAALAFWVAVGRAAAEKAPARRARRPPRA